MTLFVNHVAPVLSNIYGIIITTISLGLSEFLSIVVETVTGRQWFVLRTLEKGHSRAGEIPKMHGEFPKNILFLVGK